MKKFSLILVLLLVLSLCACSVIPSSSFSSEVETLIGWSFQYNAGTNDYSVFFGLLDTSNCFTSADVNVDIRIVNDDGDEIYAATHYISKDDFSYYTSQAAGEQYLARIRIPVSQISAGTNASGKVYLTVYQGNSLRFDEVNCTAFHCLPLLDTRLVAENLPTEIPVKDYYGEIESKIRIDEVSYVYDTLYTPQLEIICSGTKTFGTSSSSYDVISYKIYDSKGYVVDSGNIYLNKLSAGDKFKDDTITVYDVVPGETYEIRFFERS